VSTVPLNERGSVVLNGSGNGTVRIRPFGGSETWLPASVSFKASSNTLEAQCRIYIGPSPSDQYFVDGSLSGSTGDSTGRVAGYQVDSHGNYLWAVWTGGDAGATATMQVTGTEVTPGSGSPFDLSQLPAPGSGCSNPIISGGGALVYPSIHSPGFNTANPAASPVPSWAILKNGLAYFFGLVLAGGTITGPDWIINPSGMFFYSGTPAAGNLVISVTGPGVSADPFGNAVRHSGLTIYGPGGRDIFLGLGPVTGNSVLEFDTGSAIEGQAAEIVSADTGAGAAEFLQIAVDGPALNVAGLKDWFAIQMCSSNAGGSTLAEIIFSYVNNAQADNTIVNITNLGLGLFDTAIPASVPGRSALWSSLGYLRYVSGFDGNNYATGLISLSAAGQTVASTTPATVAPFSFSVKAGIPYFIQGKVNYTGNQAAGVPSFRLQGPAGSVVQVGAHFYTGSGISNTDWSAFNASVSGPTLTLGGVFDFEFSGKVTPGADGVLTLSALTSVGADTYTVNVNSWMNISPC
jgi:hypothetical protein